MILQFIICTHGHSAQPKVSKVTQDSNNSNINATNKQKTMHFKFHKNVILHYKSQRCVVLYSFFCFCKMDVKAVLSSIHVLYIFAQALSSHFHFLSKGNQITGINLWCEEIFAANQLSAVTLNCAPHTLYWRTASTAKNQGKACLDTRKLRKRK